MLYKDGDKVIVPKRGQLRHAKIMSVQPNQGTYLVSIDHGNGGFHYVREEEVKSLDQVDPKDVYELPNRVPSWY